MPKYVGRRKARRAQKRLARIRVDKPDWRPDVGPGDGGITRREARQIKRKSTRMDRRQAAKQQRKQGGFDPLEPLTGKTWRKEVQAQTRLEFGPQEREIDRAESSIAQRSANVAGYYDDYRQALRESTAKINATNEEAVKAAEARTDAAYQQDTAGQQTRNAEATAEAQRLGRGAVTSEEGARAVSAQRSQQQQQTNRMRTQASADTKYMELRGATSVQAKAEEVAKQNARANALRKERQQLAKDKGDFKVAARSKARQGEREWSAVQKEFGLKKQELKMEKGATRADRQLERQKLAAQKIVARMYSQADRAGARAQIRVAQLQLQKGKISQSQFKTIKMIYEGLPGGKGGKGDKPKLQTWEWDQVEEAMRNMREANLKPEDKHRAIKLAVANGIKARLARIAWNRYMKGVSGRGGTGGSTENPRGANG